MQKAKMVYTHRVVTVVSSLDSGDRGTYNYTFIRLTSENYPFISIYSMKSSNLIVTEAHLQVEDRLLVNMNMRRLLVTFHFHHNLSHQNHPGCISAPVYLSSSRKICVSSATTWFCFRNNQLPQLPVSPDLLQSHFCTFNLQIADLSGMVHDMR